MRFLFAFALIAALVTSTSLAQPQQGVRWKGSWTAATQEAKGRNVPILVIFVHEDEAGKALQQKLAGSEFMTASKKWVAVFADKDDGQPVKKVDDVEYSTITPGIKVEEHVTAWKELSQKFFKGDDAKAPSAVWCAPDGTELGRIEENLTTSGMTKKMEEAAKKVGESLDAEEYDEAREHIAAGDAAANDNKIQAAAAEYGKVTGLKKKAAKALVDEAQGGLNRLNDKGRIKLQKAGECISAQDWPNAKKLLKEVMDMYRGLAVAKEAQASYEDCEQKEKAKIKGK